MGSHFSTAHPPKAIGGAARQDARDNATQRKIAKDKKRKQSPDPIEEAYGDVGVLEPTANRLSLPRDRARSRLVGAPAVGDDGHRRKYAKTNQFSSSPRKT